MEEGRIMREGNNSGGKYGRTVGQLDEMSKEVMMGCEAAGGGGVMMNRCR